MTTPARMAVTRPAAADALELTPNAGADGQARHDVLEELVGVIAGKFGAKIAEKGRKHTHFPPGNTAAWSKNGLHKAPRFSLCGAVLKFCTHYNTRKREGQEGKGATLKKR